MTQQAFNAAFLQAQKSMRDPVKDGTNPHFRSQFVTLKGVADAVRPPLHKAGITVSQAIDFDGDSIFIVTTLAHVEGGSISSRCPVLTAKKNDPQALGSAITYARRYALASLCGVAPSDDDDDGEGAVRAPVKAKRKGKSKTEDAAVAELEPFELPENAVSAINKAKSHDDIDQIAKCVHASKFAAEELALIKAAGSKRRQQLGDV